MAITPLPSPWLWPAPACPTSGSGLALQFTTSMNASGDRHAFICRAPKAGTLAGFGVRTGTAVTLVNGLRFSFQDVSATTGLPDGVVDQFQTLAPGSVTASTWTEATALTHDGTGGGVKRVVAVGDYVGCVIDFTSFTGAEAVNLINGIGITIGGTELVETYHGDGSSGTYARALLFGAAFALRYDDGTYAAFAQWCLPLAAITARAFTVSTTPDERGMVIIPAITMAVAGAWLWCTLPGDATIVLYDAADAVLASVALDKDRRGTPTTAGGTAAALFAAPVTLTAGATYRLTCLPTDASGVSTTEFTVPSVAHLAACPGGAAMYLTTRTNAGAWTDTTTQRPFMGLIISGIDTGTSTGGGGSYGFVG